MTATMPIEAVQATLDAVNAGETIHVRFYKKDGSTGDYTGTLDVGANHSNSVAIYTAEGWKRFSVDRVISIEKVEG